MRHRRDIPNKRYLDVRGLKCSNGRFATRSGPLDDDFNFLYPLILSAFSRVSGGKTGCIGRALSRPLEPGRTGACPCQRIAIRVSYCDDGVVKGRENMRVPSWHHSSDFLPSLCLSFTSHTYLA